MVNRATGEENILEPILLFSVIISFVGIYRHPYRGKSHASSSSTCWLTPFLVNGFAEACGVVRTFLRPLCVETVIFYHSFLASQNIAPGALSTSPKSLANHWKNVDAAMNSAFKVPPLARVAQDAQCGRVALLGKVYLTLLPTCSECLFNFDP